MLNPVQLGRFWAKVERSAEGCCWTWRGAINSGGYGTHRTRTRVYYAHRLCYELANGAIPAGSVIDHLCRNRSCVNPVHMEAVTERENIVRGVGPTAANARKTHCAHGHEFTASNTIVVGSGKTRRGCKACRRIRRSRLKDWRSGKHR